MFSVFRFKKMQRLILLISICSLFSIYGCSNDLKKWDPGEKKKFYTFASRQLSPEPVYKKTTFVYPPENTPRRSPYFELKSNPFPKDAVPLLLPVFKVDVNTTPIETIFKDYFIPLSYSIYCSSLVCTQPISLHMVGNINEISKKIEEIGNIKIVIDHENRDIRVLPQRNEFEDKNLNGGYDNGYNSSFGNPPKIGAFTEGAIYSDPRGSDYYEY